MRERQARRKEMEARRRVRKQVDQLREIFTESVHNVTLPFATRRAELHVEISFADLLPCCWRSSSIASTQKFTSISNGTFSLAMASMIPGNGTSLKSAIDDLLPADAHLFAMVRRPPS